ncbi:MAG: tetratricopeptide repeat protein [Phenylobacterium sp.]
MGAMHRLALVGAAYGALTAGAALAAPGGGTGGGEAPSRSGPMYDPAAEYAKGVAAMNAQNWKDAKRAFDRVVSVAPEQAEAWRMLGLANLRQGDLKDARRAYDKAVKLEPDSIAARQGLGLALAGLKDAKAQEQLSWLRAKAAACGEACPQAGELKAATQAVETALAGATPSAALPPSMLFAGAQAGDAAYIEAVSLINARRYDEALASLAAAREAFGPHPDILTYQGYVWRKKGDYGRAEGYYQAALAIAPAHRGATEYYGELKVERGDLAGARVMLAQLEKACAFDCPEAQELRRWIAAGREPQG